MGRCNKLKHLQDSETIGPHSAGNLQRSRVERRCICGALNKPGRPETQGISAAGMSASGAELPSADAPPNDRILLVDLPLKAVETAAVRKDVMLHMSP